MAKQKTFNLGACLALGGLDLKNLKDLENAILEDLEKEDFLEFSTCDSHSNWTIKNHYLMEQLKSKGLKGYIIHRTYSFQVYDWKIIKDYTK